MGEGEGRSTVKTRNTRERMSDAEINTGTKAQRGTVDPRP